MHANGAFYSFSATFSYVYSLSYLEQLINFIFNYFCFVPGAGHASVGGLSITKRKNVKVIRNIDIFLKSST